MVKVNYASLQTQSSTMSSASQSRVAGFNQLISAFDSFGGSGGELIGTGYDAARAYATSVMSPYYKGCILYSEAVADAANTLADSYAAKCGAENLDEEQLQAEIDSATRGCMGLSASISGLQSKSKPAAGDAERIGRLQEQLTAAENQLTAAQKKLDNLRAFSAESPSACASADGYQGLVSKAMSGISVSFGGGGFALPEDLSWVSDVEQGWADREIALENNYLSALDKVYSGESLTETELTAIERYAAAYPDRVDASALEYVQQARQVKAEEMKYRSIIDKVDAGKSLTDEETKFFEEYKKNHPDVQVNSDSVTKEIGEKNKYSAALEKLNNNKELTAADVKAIEKYLNSHSDVSLSDGDRKRFEAAKVTVNYKQVLSKAKKEGTSAVYTEKEILALRAYYQSHPDEKVPDYLAESLNHFNTTGLAEGMDVSFNLADGYIQFTGGIIETAETVNAIGNGAWTGNKTWDKIKSLNEAVGNSDNMKLLDKADDLVNVADDAGRLTKLGGSVSNHLGKMGVIGSLASGVSTYLERKDKYGDEVALQDAAAHTGITATSTIIGSVIGSAIPIPVVGTLIGAYAGTVIGNALSTMYDESRHEKLELSDLTDGSIFKLW